MLYRWISLVVIFAHFIVLPKVTGALLAITGQVAEATYGIESTMNLILLLLLAFALVFQTPVVMVLLACSVLLMVGYSAVSIYIAMRIMEAKRMPIDTTPASLGLQYQDVTFPSRYDNVQLKGWFIPGVLPNGQLTTQRAIIMVHGDTSNREDKAVGILSLSGDLAHRGFAVLTFDMRGNGLSPAAPRSLGLYEQRDVLGAVVPSQRALRHLYIEQARLLQFRTLPRRYRRPPRAGTRYVHRRL